MSAPRVVLRSSPRPRPEGGAIARGLSRLLEERCRRRPRFSGCWTTPVPSRSSDLETYEVGGSTVRICLQDGGLNVLYHVAPWEYGLQEPWVRLIGDVIDKVADHPPEDLDVPYGELREHVLRTAGRLLRARAESEGVVLGKGIEEREKTVERMAKVVARYTVGLGLLEVLLSDDRIEDIYIDAPSDTNPVHVTLSGVAEVSSMCRCSTNLTISGDELDGMVSRLRQYTMRPFSEAHPIMETDLPGYDTRATVIGPPLSPSGTAVALRRHSRNPWTLLKLVHTGCMDSCTAGLLSFLIDGRTTMLICGARGAGKSSLLSAIMFEFPVAQRILVIEDTLELPVQRMQDLGYKVQSLFVDRGMEGSTEGTTDEALRVSLRLGESAIVLGEVRGREAQTLYQSMRTGRAGSSVLGTIHGESAHSVYERVVHDMGIPREAFMATDLVVSMGLHRPGGSSRPVRRLVEMAETSRSRGPGEFNQLIGPGSVTDEALRTSETVARIAANWGITAEAAAANIDARARMRDLLVKAADLGHRQCLEPEWVWRCNEFLWRRTDAGDHDYDGMVEEFREFVGRRVGSNDLP